MSLNINQNFHIRRQAAFTNLDMDSVHMLLTFSPYHFDRKKLLAQAEVPDIEMSMWTAAAKASAVLVVNEVPVQHSWKI